MFKQSIERKCPYQNWICVCLRRHFPFVCCAAPGLRWSQSTLASTNNNNTVHISLGNIANQTTSHLFRTGHCLPQFRLLFIAQQWNCVDIHVLDSMRLYPHCHPIISWPSRSASGRGFPTTSSTTTDPPVPPLVGGAGLGGNSGPFNGGTNPLASREAPYNIDDNITLYRTATTTRVEIGDPMELRVDILQPAVLPLLALLFIHVGIVVADTVVVDIPSPWW